MRGLPPSPAAEPLPAGSLPARLAAAEALAARLPPLLAQAERVAATVAQGVHGRRRTGPGEAFWQFRRYQPGDAVSAVDWRQTARRGRAYVREREWAAAQAVVLWADPGPRMAWASGPRLPQKGERARLLALALAALLLRGGERVGLLGSGQPPLIGRGALPLLAEALAAAPHGAATHAGLPILPLPRHATAVLVGDFLDDAGTLIPALHRLAGQGGRGHLLQVLDPAEESPPYHGRVRFTAVDGRESWMVARAEDVMPAYRARLEAHRAVLRDACRALGWSFAVHHTDQPPETALMALFRMVAEGGAP